VYGAIHSQTTVAARRFSPASGLRTLIGVISVFSCPVQNTLFIRGFRMLKRRKPTLCTLSEREPGLGGLHPFGRWSPLHSGVTMGVQGKPTREWRVVDLSVRWYPARCAKCLKRFVPRNRQIKVCYECQARVKRAGRARKRRQVVS
jgi:hypothetical protein